MGSRARWAPLCGALVLTAVSFALLRAHEPLGRTLAQGCPDGSMSAAALIAREHRVEAALGKEEAEEREREAEREAGGESEREAGAREGAGDARAAAICIPGGKVPESFAELAERDSSIARRASAPSDHVRPGARRAALRQRARLARTRVNGASGRWKPVGRGPLAANDFTYAVARQGLPQLSGRMNDLVPDPRTGRVFAAVSYGGVFMTENTGRTWRSIGDGLASQVVGSVAHSSFGKRGTLIALTGDQNNGGDSNAGMGAYYTRDVGRTWHHSKGLPDGLLGFRIVSDPTNPAVFYAATGGGLYRTTDGGRNFVNVDLPTGPCHGDSSKRGCFLANMVTDVVVQAPDRFGNKGGAVVAAVGWRGGRAKYPDGSTQASENGLYRSVSGRPEQLRAPAGGGVRAPAADRPRRARPRGGARPEPRLPLRRGAGRRAVQRRCADDRRPRGGRSVAAAVPDELQRRLRVARPRLDVDADGGHQGRDAAGHQLGPHADRRRAARRTVRPGRAGLVQRVHPRRPDAPDRAPASPRGSSSDSRRCGRTTARSR